MNLKTEDQLQTQIDTFNKIHPIRSIVYIELDSHKVIQTIIVNKASILNLRTAVIWVNALKGCYLLDRVIEVSTYTRESGLEFTHVIINPIVRRRKYQALFSFTFKQLGGETARHNYWG
ncbi:MAG TPA: hypothetical protein VFC67_08855 [Prolixibacteraceae bacterium]|nr:hypothetical protein [Prolixibacteraceae bacterium]